MRSSVGDYDPPVVQLECIVDPVQLEVIGALRGPGRQAGLRADLPAQARIQRWTGVLDDDDAGAVLDLDSAMRVRLADEGSQAVVVTAAVTAKTAMRPVVPTDSNVHGILCYRAGGPPAAFSKKEP